MLISCVIILSVFMWVEQISWVRSLYKQRWLYFFYNWSRKIYVNQLIIVILIRYQKRRWWGRHVIKWNNPPPPTHTHTQSWAVLNALRVVLRPLQMYLMNCPQILKYNCLIETISSCWFTIVNLVRVSHFMRRVSSLNKTDIS